MTGRYRELRIYLLERSETKILKTLDSGVSSAKYRRVICSVARRLLWLLIVGEMMKRTGCIVSEGDLDIEHLLRRAYV